jgi:hypothetical protein
VGTISEKGKKRLNVSRLRKNGEGNGTKMARALGITTVSVMLLLGFIGTTLAYADYTQMIFTPTRQPEPQRDLANSVLDSGDVVFYHYGAGRDPKSTELAALKAVTAVPNSRKGLEFFNLADIKEHARTVKANGFGFIAYDLERGTSPESEVNNPVRSFREARLAANSAGVQLMAAPSHAISSGQYADDIAKLVHRYHLQSQVRQDDDTTCDIMRNWVVGRVSLLERANSNLAGKITYQVTLSGNDAEGKTVFETAKDCITKTSPTGVDGNAIWWNGASFDDGSYEELLRYHERTFS